MAKSKSQFLKEIKSAESLFAKDSKDKAQELLADLHSQLEASEDLNNDIELLSTLGIACINLQSFDTAKNIFEKLAKDHPDNTVYQTHLAASLASLDLFQEAETHSIKALEIDPNNWSALNILGFIKIAESDFKKSFEYLSKAYELKPSHPDIVSNLAIACLRTDHKEKGIELAKKTLANNLSSFRPYTSLGLTLSETGEIEEAKKHLKRAMKLNPLSGEPYHNYALISKFDESERPLIKKMEKTLEEPIPVYDRYLIHFALGEAYNALGEWQTAFKHFHQGNILASTLRNRLVTHKNLYAFNKHTFTPAFMNKHKSKGDPSDKPVFIIGMPRTGTTLMEQIIASHTKGGGAGELDYMHASVLYLYDFNNKKSNTEILSNYFESDDAKQLKQDYLQILSDAAPDKERVVDKAPMNFFHMGFIHTLFPNAKFIHMKRNPVDTCISCYTKAFDVQDWSYNIDAIIDQYKKYMDLMAYWKKVIPEDRLIDIQYESLINNTEEEAQKALSFIGLEWEPECLDFHTRKAAVKTSSLFQVRQPIYKTSVRRWEKYGEDIIPFLEGLYDFLDEEDIKRAHELGYKINKPSLLKKIFG